MICCLSDLKYFHLYYLSRKEFIGVLVTYISVDLVTYIRGNPVFYYSEKWQKLNLWRPTRSKEVTENLS